MTTTMVRAPTNDAGPPPDGGRRRNRRIWTVAAALVVAFTAALGYLAGNETQADTQFDQAHQALIVTQAHLRVVGHELAAVRGALEVVNGQVAQGSAALADDEAKLTVARAALVNAQANVAHQSAALADLHTCLGGVQQALNATSVGDVPHAVDALSAVTTSCNNAVTADG